jgi:putative molybdopterin biosynthesis protein
MIEDKTSKKHRTMYIDNLPLEDALDAYKASLTMEHKTDSIPLEEALNRITYEPVFAQMSSPHYQGAAMDGIVVKAKDTYGASERTPIVLTEGIDFDYINTGNAIPQGKDAVIMIEDVDPIEEQKIQIIQPAYPWQHVRAVGEDLVKHEMILPSRHCIRGIDLGAMAAAGVNSVVVFSKVRVGILPTGSEIKKDKTGIDKGQILDSNSLMFSGLIGELGGIVTSYPPTIDDPSLLKKAILKGVEENDILIINAGSSAGSKDFTVDLIRELGEVVVHGIAIKPGKPTILGQISKKMVVGIPGYPVSAYFSFETFVRPFIEWFNGRPSQREYREAVLSQRVVSSLKHEEFIRVTLGEVNGVIIATPLSRGAGNTMSLVRADGVLTVQRDVEGIEKGTKVTIRLLKNAETITGRLVAIGSHDVIMDIISDYMPIASGHVGSLGGIMAMKRGECHIAPIHLLDEDTGIYNDSFVLNYFPHGTMAIIKGLHRLQGFIVQKGNPKQIHDFSDLTQEDVVFVNRQKGSGTRQLLDYNLKKLHIDSAHIKGYEREMNTHMAVAADVQVQGADVALGTYSAAKAMELDFVPVGYEYYEFLVQVNHLEDQRVKQFIDTLTSKPFQETVMLLGGYEVEGIGEIRQVGELND